VAYNADAFDVHGFCVLACTLVLGFCRIFSTGETCALAMAAALTLITMLTAVPSAQPAAGQSAAPHDCCWDWTGRPRWDRVGPVGALWGTGLGTGEVGEGEEVERNHGGRAQSHHGRR
jgi:hypothetical protein